MNRRQFLTRALPAATLPFLVGGLPVYAHTQTALTRLLAQKDDANDRVLVLIQLNGGNDGLNTFVPIDQYARLANARPRLLLPENQLHKINPAQGFHPAMATFRQLFEEGKLGVVQDVGYPYPNFSHFRSTDIWTSASDSEQIITSGWIGRYLAHLHPDYPETYPNSTYPDPLALTIGPIVSATCQGPSANMGLAITDASTFYQLVEGGEDEVPPTPAGAELAYIRQVMNQTNLYTARIREAAENAQNLSPLYPNAGQNELADQLRVVANLIAGGLQTPVFIVSLGGFDTHALQREMSGTAAEGQHARLLGWLAEAVWAFQDDLKRLGLEDRVLTMTFSEFGRRIGENLSYGTDHGAAAPLFVFGTKVRPQVHGLNPIIPANASANDSVPMQFDFRSVYASVLQDWFLLPSEAIQEVLFRDFEYVPIIGDEVTALPVEAVIQQYQAFPNPFGGNLQVRFQLMAPEPVLLQLFDHQGRKIQTLIEKTLAPGPHHFTFEGQHLPPGHYYLRLRVGTQQLSQYLLKA